MWRGPQSLYDELLSKQSSVVQKQAQLEAATQWSNQNRSQPPTPGKCVRKEMRETIHSNEPDSRAARPLFRLTLHAQLPQVHKDGSIIRDILLGDAIPTRAQAPRLVARAHAAAVIDVAAQIPCQLLVALAPALDQPFSTGVKLRRMVCHIVCDILYRLLDRGDVSVREEDRDKGFNGVERLWRCQQKRRAGIRGW